MLSKKKADIFAHAGESEDESDIAEPSDGNDAFMHSYSDTLNEELKGTTLSNTFVRANGEPVKKDEVSLLLYVVSSFL